MIYGYVIIEKDEFGEIPTLTIEPGCQVYFHKNSGIIVKPLLTDNGGTLIVGNPNGDPEPENPVLSRETD